MTKQAFIDSLKAGLSFLSPSELSDVVSEFEEHFAVGKERGHFSSQSLHSLISLTHFADTLQAFLNALNIREK